MPVHGWGLVALERLTHVKAGFAATVAVYLFGSVLVGVAMAGLIEVPALRLRDRWFPGRARLLGEMPLEPPARTMGASESHLTQRLP